MQQQVAHLFLLQNQIWFGNLKSTDFLARVEALLSFQIGQPLNFFINEALKAGEINFLN